METFNDDVLSIILEQCSIITTRQVCKRWNKIAGECTPERIYNSIPDITYLEDMDNLNLKELFEYAKPEIIIKCTTINEAIESNSVRGFDILYNEMCDIERINYMIIKNKSTNLISHIQPNITNLCYAMKFKFYEVIDMLFRRNIFDRNRVYHYMHARDFRLAELVFQYHLVPDYEIIMYIESYDALDLMKKFIDFDNFDLQRPEEYLQSLMHLGAVNIARFIAERYNLNPNDYLQYMDAKTLQKLRENGLIQ